MKALFRKIFFRGQGTDEYIAVRMLPGEVVERVTLINNNQQLNISDTHAIVCQTPFYIAVWLPAHQLAVLEAGEPVLYITHYEKPVARLQVAVNQRIDIGEDVLVILAVKKTRCYQLSLAYQYFLTHYFIRKKKLTFAEGKIYAALFSWPRKVILTSFMDKNYYNIFPMDFQCSLEDRNMVMLGLRTSNITLKKIIDAGKVVIADTDTVNINTVYWLGRHHSSAPPSLSNLPLTVSGSERFNFPVPDASASYKEIELIRHYELGSHVLMIGKVVNDVKRRMPESLIHHIHFFHLFQSNYTKA